MSSHTDRQTLAVERARTLDHVLVVHPHDCGPRIVLLARSAGVQLVRSDSVQRGEVYVMSAEQSREWK